MTHFCPNCWKILDAHSGDCPDCGFRLADFDAASYERKLLLALKHPVRENRLMAVEILGRIRSRQAIASFRQILAANEDCYLLREVLQALAQIGTPEAIDLLLEAQRHPSRLVRDVARELVAPTKDQPRRQGKRP